METMEYDFKPVKGLQRLRMISERRKKVDIIGKLIGRFDFTVRQIFSYLDFSSLKNAGNVCKTWNEYLMELWMEKLRKTEPFLEYLDNLPSIHYTRATTMRWSKSRQRLELSKWKLDYQQDTSASTENSDPKEESDPNLPWKNLFDIVEKYGSIEIMIDLSKEIECIAILNRYMNIDDEAELQLFKNVAKIFEDAYVDEKFQKEMVEFDNDMVAEYDFKSKTVFFRNKQKGLAEDLRQELGGTKDFTPSFNKQFEKTGDEDDVWSLDQFEDAE